MNNKTYKYSNYNTKTQYKRIPNIQVLILEAFKTTLNKDIILKRIVIK